LKKSKSFFYERLDFYFSPSIIFFTLFLLLDFQIIGTGLYKPWVPFLLIPGLFVVFLSFKKTVITIGEKNIIKKTGPFISLFTRTYDKEDFSDISISERKVVSKNLIKSVYIVYLTNNSGQKLMVSLNNDFNDARNIHKKINKIFGNKSDVKKEQRDIKSLPNESSSLASLVLFFRKDLKAKTSKPDKSLNQVEGWNWGAFIFGPFWCFYYKLYMETLVAFTLGGLSLFFLSPLIHGAIGWQGNNFAYRKEVISNIELFKEDQSKWACASIFMIIIYFYCARYWFSWLGSGGTVEFFLPENF